MPSSPPPNPIGKGKYGWSCNLATHIHQFTRLRMTAFNLRNPYVSLCAVANLTLHPRS
jgi:hypothetical protein